jgi:AcrR family transcriptional regulator
MSPRNKELSQEMRNQSRAALMTAARKLFAEVGYFNCRISDIARQAGMSQGNVYWYFSGKEELLKAVLDEAFKSMGTVMEQAAAGQGTARQKLDALVDGLLDYASQGSEFTGIMISLMGDGGMEMINRLGFDMSQIGLGYTQSVLSILTQAQVEGIIRADLDPLPLTMMFFGLFNGLNLVYGQGWLDLPPETIKAGVFRLFGVIS